jgi:DNA-binding MarR family transcriptional regulator
VTGAGVADEQALRAWARLQHAHAGLARSFNGHLQRAHGLTVTDFDALHQLMRAEAGRMRRTDLAGAVGLTPSGVCRLLAGLEQAGLVRSADSASDARVSYACITPAGRQAFAAAAADHVAGLRALFAERFDADELAALVHLLGRLPGAASGERARVAVSA